MSDSSIFPNYRGLPNYNPNNPRSKAAILSVKKREIKAKYLDVIACYYMRIADKQEKVTARDVVLHIQNLLTQADNEVKEVK